MLPPVPEARGHPQGSLLAQAARKRAFPKTEPVCRVSLDIVVLWAMWCHGEAPGLREGPALLRA